jgi:hypothetical protein
MCRLARRDDILGLCQRGILVIGTGVGWVELFFGAPLIQRHTEHGEVAFHGDGWNDIILRDKGRVLPVQGVTQERIKPVENENDLLIRRVMSTRAAFRLKLVNEISDMLSKWLVFLVPWLKGLCGHLSEEGVNEPYNLVQGEVPIAVCGGEHMREM